jgi:hypothetical protein
MAAADYDFFSTRNEIIQRALRICGVLSLGESVSADQYTQAAQALNSLVKSWQNEHIFLWTVLAGTLPLSATVASYALPTDPAIMWIDKAWRRSGNNDEPIRIISWREYNDIYNKTDPGTPTVIALDNRIAPTVYVYPVPPASDTIFYLGVSKLKDFDSSSSTADLTQRFLDSLTYGLAMQLADEYGLPMSERQWIASKYEDAWKKAKRADTDRFDYEFVDSAFRD